MRVRSSTIRNETTIRTVLATETTPGQVHLAGIAVSRATQMSERTSRDLIRRVNHLRTLGLTDPEILVCLNPPRQAAS